MKKTTWPFATRMGLICTFVLALGLVSPPDSAAQRRNGDAPRDTTPTLGLGGGLLDFHTADLDLTLVEASQTVAALHPVGVGSFDFTPGDRLARRSANGFHHLGDLHLRLRTDTAGPWREYSTAASRHPVTALTVSSPVLAAADLAPTLPADIPLDVTRYWEVDDGHLVLRFELRNGTSGPVEIGALGIPMVFNNILGGRSLPEAHAVNSFSDPYIGEDAGYIQVSRLTGLGPTLLVVPHGDTPLEAYRPIEDRTRRSNTFEGFYEWMVHSKAYAENEWSEADPWNPPTSEILTPGETRSYGIEFLLADGVRDIEPTLIANHRPVAVGIPGYVLPQDMDAKLFLANGAGVRSMEVEPEGALTIVPGETTPHGWRSYTIHGRRWGRARLTVTYDDGSEQTIQYKVIRPEPVVADDLGVFLTTKQWFDDPSDPFGRAPSVISYDYREGHQVTEDNRVWIAGLSDEGGAGSWVAAIMKQLVEPNAAEIAKLEDFVDNVLWGSIQIDEGERKFGVRKSVFYYEPDAMPAGTYSDSVRYGGWSSWDAEQAGSVGRSYDYPHVAAAYWVFYRLAREHRGLVTHHPWSWYLDHAYQTAQAMVRDAPGYARFGQMEGTIFLYILRDLQREKWTAEAAMLESTMKRRADLWHSLDYPFGSEMPWDSTGQEEVYAWCTYFGYRAKALITLDAILGYMPTVPHWGYNGSARRYWDFQYAGRLRRIERQLHHYGSGLNAIPVLSEYRRHPEDLYLLRVGYGGVMGAISNVTRDGFGPSAFHAFPSTLRIDGYSGDFGMGYFGHVVNTGTYVARDPELGWLAFGGDLRIDNGSVEVRPLDTARSRVYVAPLGLWLTLDAGTFARIEIGADVVRLTLDPTTAHTPRALLRIEQPAAVAGVGRITPAASLAIERGAYVIPLSATPTEIELRVGRQP